MVNTNRYQHSTKALVVEQSDVGWGIGLGRVGVDRPHGQGLVVKIITHLNKDSSLYPVHRGVHRDGRFGSKVGQIGPKWDKSGTFSDQISVHLAPSSQTY